MIDFMGSMASSAIGAGLGAYFAFLAAMNVLSSDKRHDLILFEIREIEMFLKSERPRAAGRQMRLNHTDANDIRDADPEDIFWDNFAHYEPILRYLPKKIEDEFYSSLHGRDHDDWSIHKLKDELIAHFEKVILNKQSELEVTGHYSPLYSGLKRSSM